MNRLFFAHLNIISVRNKFDSLVTIVKENIDVFLISETKIDSPFPTPQFQIEEYTTPSRLDKRYTWWPHGFLYKRRCSLEKIQDEAKEAIASFKN